MRRKAIVGITTIMLASAIVLVLPAHILAESFVWTAQVSGTGVVLPTMTAGDANHAWVVGQAGVIRHTNNGGSSWGPQASGTGEDLSGISSTGTTHAWASGDHGVIIVTVNGGMTWNPQNSGVANDLSRICMVDDLHGWVVGWNGTIRHTEAGGTPWVGQNSHTTENLWGISAADSQNAWAVGNTGTILHTSNAGTTWSAQNSGTANHLRDVFALDSSRVWVVGDNGTLLFTTNGGQAWVSQSNTSENLRAVSAADSTHAWIVGFDHTVLFSSDCGAHWYPQSCPLTGHLFGIAVADPMHAFASGSNGDIMAGLGNEPTWYLAEGTSAWGFSTYVSIENPNTTAVHAAITYMTGTGNVSGGTVTLAAQSQTTLNPADTLGNKDFSTKVVSTEGMPIAVDRTMSWTGPGAASPEGHSSIGVTAADVTWYLPEGCSAFGFECWLLIQNPNASTATCNVTYMIEGGAPVTKTHTVPANSRKSFNMETDIGQKNASIKVDSNVPVIPERAMYRNSRREGHDSIGTTVPAPDFYLAEGTTAWGFTTWVLIQNPCPNASDVTITYMTPSGAEAQAPFSLPPNSRKTIKVNDVAGMGNTDFSTQVHGSQPLIAERSMYWDSGTGEACHDSIGMDAAHTNFYLPDGQSSGGYETWTLVQNPNSSAVNVEVSYLKAGGGVVSLTESIPANSRMTFNMADKVPSGRASSMVTCVTPGKKIMVERAMYWNNRGAGTDTIGGYSD